MSCDALLTILKSCDNNTGGIYKFYVNLQDNVDMTTLTTDPGNNYLIDALSLLGGADTFIEFEFRRNTSGYTEDSNIDLINGSSFVTQTINLMFHRRESIKSNALKVLGSGQQYLTGIVQDANGLYWFFPFLQLTATGEGSGVARADGSKYSVTLLAENEFLAFEIEESVVTGLL
ncbi:MAG: hypothetical protein WD512_08280 [Candidatus Paceibacterota bacterium]